MDDRLLEPRPPILARTSLVCGEGIKLLPLIIRISVIARQGIVLHPSMDSHGIFGADYSMWSTICEAGLPLDRTCTSSDPEVCQCWRFVTWLFCEYYPTIQRGNALSTDIHGMVMGLEGGHFLKARDFALSPVLLSLHQNTLLHPYDSRWEIILNHVTPSLFVSSVWRVGTFQ